MIQLLKSISYALQGIASCFTKEQNFRIHTSAIVAVCFFGILLKFNIHYWCIVILCFGLVLGMELMNSAVEKLCDFVEPNQNEKIKLIKDMSAGAVLIQAISALIVACIIGLNLYELWKTI